MHKRSLTFLASSTLAACLTTIAAAQETPQPVQLPSGFVQEVKHAPDGRIARTQVKVAGRSMSRFFPDSLRDGPHVSWKGAVPTVRYACFGEMALRELAPEDAGFQGFCEDEEVHYVLSRRPDQPQRRYEDVDRVFIAGNVHGHYDELLELLRSAGILSPEGEWQWGGGHLVVLGNVVDRGPQVTKTLWFLRSLALDAAEQGGAVHVLLGPSELRLLSGGGGQLHWKYSGDGLEPLLGPYVELYTPDTELGQWLRSLNGIIRINDTIFSAGGLNPTMSWSEDPLEEINGLYREVFSDTSGAAGEGPAVRRLRQALSLPSDRDASSAAEMADLLQRLDAAWIVAGGDGEKAQSTAHGPIMRTAGPMREGVSAEGLLMQGRRFTRVTAEGIWEGLSASGGR